MNNIYFTKKLAETIAFDFQHLIGCSFVVPFGKSTMEFKIDYVEVIKINENEYDVQIRSDANRVKLREIFFVLNIIKTRLLFYIQQNQIEFHPNRYGIGYSKITNETDEAGIDLYL